MQDDIKSTPKINMDSGLDEKRFADHDERLSAGKACLAAALEYRAMGLSPIILCDPDHVAVEKHFPGHGTRCKSPGKAPVFPWKRYQGILPSPEEIREWWRYYPVGNLGAILGQISRLVRIDIDGKAGRQWLDEWSQGDLPDTWTFLSPGSTEPQRLYSWPATLPCKSTSSAGEGDHEELRLQGNKQLTVIPPSRHPKGDHYTWLPGHSPAEQVEVERGDPSSGSRPCAAGSRICRRLFRNCKTQTPCGRSKRPSCMLRRW